MLNSNNLVTLMKGGSSMYFDQPILSNPNEVALEEVNHIRHQMKEEWKIRDTYFPYVESYLPKTEHLLFRHISKYEDKYNDILSSPYPTKILPFGDGEGAPDTNIVFKCLNINYKEFNKFIKSLPLPGQLTHDKAAFNPIQIALFLIIRYYLVTNQLKKVKIIYPYYGYSIYWKRFNHSWRTGVKEEVMIYAINQMSYRNLIKKLGSLRALLYYIVEHTFENYREGVANCCDEDIRYILDQVQSDIGSKVNNIAQAYYAIDKNSDGVVFTGSSLYSDDTGTARVDASVTSSAVQLAQRYSSKFMSDSIDLNRVKTACSMATDVSYKEIFRTLEYILSTVDSNDLHNFYVAIFLWYLTLDDPKCTVESVNSLRFVAVTKEMIRKGNSSNKNIKAVIEYCNKWLEAGSNTFKLSNREATKANFRRAIFNYFLLSVS